MIFKCYKKHEKMTERTNSFTAKLTDEMISDLESIKKDIEEKTKNAGVYVRVSRMTLLKYLIDFYKERKT